MSRDVDHPLGVRDQCLRTRRRLLPVLDQACRTLALTWRAGFAWAS